MRVMALPALQKPSQRDFHAMMYKNIVKGSFFLAKLLKFFKLLLRLDSIAVYNSQLVQGISVRWNNV